MLLFKREVHLARQVTHPNVCRIFDVFRHRPPARGRGREPAADVVFLAMELLHGETLADRLRREGRLSTADALVLARQMAAALTAAHRAGVVHRDFKTAERDARAGQRRPARTCAPSSPTSAWPSAARKTSAPDLSLSLDDAGEISGTPAYMAPEQVEGGPATPATDSTPSASSCTRWSRARGRSWPTPRSRSRSSGCRSRRRRRGPTCPTWIRAGRPRSCAAWPASLRIASPASRRRSRRWRDRPRAEAARSSAGDARCAGAARRWSSLAAIGVAAFVRARVSSARAPRASPPSPSCPSRTSAKDPEKEYLSDGISESLIRRLSQLPGVKVIANSSTMRYKGKDADPQEVARALGVRGVVTGKVLQRGDGPLDQRGADRHARPDAGVGRAVQPEGGRRPRRAGGDLPGDRRAAPGTPHRRPAAGAGHEGERQPAGLRAAPEGAVPSCRAGARKTASRPASTSARPSPSIRPMRPPTPTSPTSTAAWSGSSIYDPKEYLPKAEAAARKAIELDPGNADAHFTPRQPRDETPGSGRTAERDFKRAIELNPNLALAHRWYAQLPRAQVGRHEAGPRRDPAGPRARSPLARASTRRSATSIYLARRYDKAIEALNKTVEMDRSYPYPHLFLGHAYAAKGMYAASVAAYEEAIRLGLDTPITQIRLGRRLRTGGRARPGPGDPQAVPGGQGLRLPRRAGDPLRRPRRARSRPSPRSRRPMRRATRSSRIIGVVPAFDPLRADPRFTGARTPRRPGALKRRGLDLPIVFLSTHADIATPNSVGAKVLLDL